MPTVVEQRLAAARRAAVDRVGRDRRAAVRGRRAPGERHAAVAGVAEFSVGGPGDRWRHGEREVARQRVGAARDLDPVERAADGRERHGRSPVPESSPTRAQPVQRVPGVHGERRPKSWLSATFTWRSAGGVPRVPDASLEAPRLGGLEVAPAFVLESDHESPLITVAFAKASFAGVGSHVSVMLPSTPTRPCRRPPGSSSSCRRSPGSEEARPGAAQVVVARHLRERVHARARPDAEHRVEIAPARVEREPSRSAGAVHFHQTVLSTVRGSAADVEVHDEVLAGLFGRVDVRAADRPGESRDRRRVEPSCRSAARPAPARRSAPRRSCS